MRMVSLQVKEVFKRKELKPIVLAQKWEEIPPYTFFEHIGDEVSEKLASVPKAQHNTFSTTISPWGLNVVYLVKQNQNSRKLQELLHIPTKPFIFLLKVSQLFLRVNFGVTCSIIFLFCFALFLIYLYC